MPVKITTLKPNMHGIEQPVTEASRLDDEESCYNLSVGVWKDGVITINQEYIVNNADRDSFVELSKGEALRLLSVLSDLLKPNEVNK